MKKLFISILVLLSVGCAKTEGTSTGNPLVAVQFKSFNSFDAGSGPDALSISNLKVCFKRLRFKPVRDDNKEDKNIDLDLGETTIVSSGTLLTTASVPAGTYSRVEFDLYPNCDSGKSVQVTNSNGSFSTNNAITIRFDGTLTLTQSQDLDLNIQAIITAMDSVTNNSEIKAKAEAASGSF